MHERNFVMIPLNDISENHMHPILKISNKEILSNCIDSCKVNIMETEVIIILFIWGYFQE